jgi:uncharacterized protein YjbI with pentapeptide repeats
MVSPYWSLLGATAMLLTGPVPVGAAEPTAETTPVGTVARLPGAGCILRQLDGSALCCTAGEGVFLSLGDPHRWSAVPGVRREFFSCKPIGGDRARFFLGGDTWDFPREPAEKVSAIGPRYLLAAAGAGGEFNVVWDKTPGFLYENALKFSAFASKDVGAIAWNETVMAPHGGIGGVRNLLFLTVDGGKTWRPTPPPEFPARSETIRSPNGKQPFVVPVFEDIAGVLWVSPSRLLISGSSAQLCERTGDGTLRRVWCAAVPGSGSGLVLDGDCVWVGSGSRGTMNRLRLADGHLDATVKIADPAERGDKKMTACHQCLLVWGSTPTGLPATTPRIALDIWARDPKQGYVRRARITAPPLAGILPLKAPLCLAIAASGEGLHLDLDKGTLSPAPLQVTPLPLAWRPFAAVSGKPADSAARPAVVARFPGSMGGVRLQLDGSAVCWSEGDLFFADGDLREWSPLRPSPDHRNWGVLGGDRQRLFVAFTEESQAFEPNSAKIEAVDLSGRTAVVRSELSPNQRAVFASKDVGVIYSMADRADVLLTTDGGTTWNATPVPFPTRTAPRPAEGAAAAPGERSYAPRHSTPPMPGPGFGPPSGEVAEFALALHWVSPSRLLASGTQRSVGLFEVQRGALRPVWIIALPAYTRLFALDGEYAWVGDYDGTSPQRLRLSDGRVDAVVKADFPVVGMNACHGALLTWDRGSPILSPLATSRLPTPVPPATSGSEGVEAKAQGEATAWQPDSLSIWRRDAKGAYARRGKVCIRYLDIAAGRLGGGIAGILPLEAPCCLLISSQGAGFRLDLDKAVLSPAALQVTPPPPAPVGSKAEMRQLSAVYMSLLSHVPRSERDEIVKEYLRKVDPTWGGRVTVDGSSAARGRADGERLPLRECNLWAIGRLREYLKGTKPRVLGLGSATDDDLPHIENLANLEYLDLSVSRVSDAGLAHLEYATELRELDLRLTPVTGAGLVHLKKLTRLRRLGLLCPNVTDAGLAGLKELPQLEELELGGKITDAGLVNLAGLARLRELDLSGAQITDAGLERLRGFAQLRKLDISRTNVTDAGLAHLTGFTELRWLGLGGDGRSGRPGPDGRMMWTYHGKMRITDAGLRHLTALPQLERLDVFGARVTDAGLESLKRMTRLQRLNLGATDVTSEGLKDLQRGLPNCRFIDRAFW